MIKQLEHGMSLMESKLLIINVQMHSQKNSSACKKETIEQQNKIKNLVRKTRFPSMKSYPSLPHLPQMTHICNLNVRASDIPVALGDEHPSC